jgi:hypothetical protein
MSPPSSLARDPADAALVAKSGIIARNCFARLSPRFVMFPTLFQCKDCGGFTGYRSRPKDLTERFLLPLLLLRPTRCGDCFKRTYQSVFVKVRPRRESKKPQGATA